uniref:TonB-dependent receptor domain-containing protein n=1 Tax=Acinetobacter baumannii TaxID=470 RepID=UPI000A67B67B
AFTLGLDQKLRSETEWNQKRTKGGDSTIQARSHGTTDGGSATGRSLSPSPEIFSRITEANMAPPHTILLKPALRFDHHSIAGNNWSPSLNLSQELTDDWTLKLGIARAYKAPNLYQLNPNYILYSNGQGCYASSSACYLMGNSDLKAET